MPTGRGILFSGHPLWLLLTPNSYISLLSGGIAVKLTTNIHHGGGLA